MTFEQWWTAHYGELSMRSSPITKVTLNTARDMARTAWDNGHLQGQIHQRDVYQPQRVIPAGFTSNEVVAAVECPRCGAQKDVRCVSSTGKQGLVYPHQARRKAFLQSRQQKG